ncbi:MAG: hypothetical protein WD271_04345 [Acidimicrobiia bacterium]
MLLLAPLAALLVVGMVVALTGARSIATRRTRHPSESGVAAGVVLVGIAVGVVLVVGVFVLVVGRGGETDEPGGRRERVPAAAETGADRPAETRSAATSALAAREPTLRELETGTREVVVTAPTGDGFPAPEVVDEIDGRVVLRVSAFGFEPSVSGRVEQCVATRTGVDRCGNHFRVQFDVAGAARFQYLVGDRYLGAGAPTCGTGAIGCVVRLTDGTTTAMVSTVFGRPVGRSRVTMTPRPTALASGERVEVSLSGFTQGDAARVTVCAAPATTGKRRCGTPGPVARVRIGDNGAATTRLVLREEDVGSERVACGRDTPCAIIVTTDSGVATVPPVEITFASGPGTSYDATRLALGLALAAILLGVAVLLVRTTDWRKPSEAETPVMDAAPLADL